jgi:hypothetical protein
LRSKMTFRSKRTLVSALAVVVGFAVVFASPAEAAKRHRHKYVAAPAKTSTHIRSRTATRCRGGNFVPCGPLYNGQDYLGEDPDPNIRSQIIRDLDGRYGGLD